MPDKKIDAKTIFNLARKIENEEARSVYLQQICEGDDGLIHAVTELLRGYWHQRSFLETPVIVIATMESGHSAGPLGSTIGPYKLIEQIGEGGMGVVYLASQKEPVRRDVALKVIKAGMDTQQVVARFEAERQAMAMLNHPNIAKVLDAGATEAGRPYFVMELVKGSPITEFCDSHKMDTQHRLQLFITVCQAVQHAHQKGLIHRDIKPSNVLVEMHDVVPVPKVIDFGVAKAIGNPLTEKSLHSGFHQMVGTPLYMSPEQAGQSSIDIDTRSDIYSLGVLLYEVLTGQTPFESEALRNVDYDEMRRMISEVDPPRPSARVSTLEAKVLSTISDCRSIEARKLSDQLRGELDWIVMKALEKDRNRRYDTASEFAIDVQRFLNDEAVHACPPSTLYRFRKLVSRNRASLTAATLVATALIVGTAVSAWQAIRARDAQGQTEIAKQQLDQRYRIAKEAVDTYLLRVTQDERLDHPSFRQLRQSLLEAALPYYDQLHEISPTDEQSKAARAETLNQLGSVKHELGRFDESLEAFEEAATLFDQLASEHATQFVYRQGLAKALVNLADHYRTRGADSESLEYEEHALALRQRLVEEHADSDLLKLELAQSYTNVGVGTQEEQGRDWLERAIEIWQDLAHRFPDRPLYREYLSLGYQNLAHRVAWYNAEDAIPFHEFAIDLRNQLAIEQPESRKSQIQLAQSHQVLADTLEKLSPRLVEAREHCEESIRILQVVSKKHPEWPEVKSHLASSQNKLAHTLKELGELTLAHEACETGLQTWEQLQSEYPDMPEYEVGLAATQHNLGSILLAQGQATEGMSILVQSRDRLLEMLDRIGPHDTSKSLLLAINTSLADTRKAMVQGLDQSFDEDIPERKTQTAGEDLRPSKFLTDLSNSPTHGLRVEGMASSLSQTEEQEQSMKRLRTKMSQSASRSPIRNKLRLTYERLEDRAMMAVDISISDASVVEGDKELRYIDDFVSANSGGLRAPRGVVFGPEDGMLYVATGLPGQSEGDSSNQILRFDPLTGAFVDVAFTSGDNGVFFDLPWGMTFGPDNKLYVSARRSSNILRYDPSTDTLVEFVPETRGVYRPCGVAFGPDGNLYVSNADNGTTSDSSLLQDQIVRFGGPFSDQPGAFIDVFIHSNGLLDNNQAILFQEDYLYIANSRHFNQGNVLRYTLNGDFDSEFIANGSGGLTLPSYFSFHAGNLFVNNQEIGQILQYDANGSFVSTVVNVPLESLTGFTFDDKDNLYVGFRDHRQTSTNADDIARVRRYGPSSLAAFTISLNTPSATLVTVDYAITDGVGTNGAHAGADYDATSDTLTLTFAAGQTTRTILVPTLNDLTSEPTETFTVVLSNSVGATIAVGVGIGSILDNDPFTKFYVVNDASTDRTYEYGDTGASVENYVLGGGNTAPRGASSTSMGTTVWVVDANKSVYAYNTNGALQGSWAAGGLQTTAQLEGIATNGTDVWLVDNKADKVYRYTGAASLTGGSQNAASSFSLNSGNKNPKDIVTDGNYLWVVDDSTLDKVFKYTLSGTYVGSWTISTSGASKPTGITLDPSNVSHLWIVDSGTDRVYQYDNSAGLTSGSKSANSNWALAVGNTNPQGIADPPPPASSSMRNLSEFQSPSVESVSLLWFTVAASNVSTAPLQQVQSKVRSTDEFMTVLGLAKEQPRALVSFGRMPTLVADKPIDIGDREADEIEEDDIEDLIALVANDFWR